MSDEGFARETTEYDEFGRMTGRAYFGVHNEPAIGKTERYHRARLSTWTSGNRLETLLLGRTTGR